VFLSLVGDFFSSIAGLLYLFSILVIILWPLFLILGLVLLVRLFSAQSADHYFPDSTAQAPAHNEPFETIISLLVLVLAILLMLYYSLLELYRYLLKRWRTQS
jgi:Ca2+/H+ antiporter